MNQGVRVVIAAVLTAIAVFLAVSLFSYAPEQMRGSSPVAANLAGPMGAWIAHHTIGSWGLAAFLVPLAFLVFAAAVLRDHDPTALPRRITAAVLLIPIMAGLAQLLPVEGSLRRIMVHWDMERIQGLGGNLGWLLCGPIHPEAKPDFPGGLLTRYLDRGGSGLVLVLAAIGCGLLLQIGLSAALARVVAAVRKHRQPTPQPERRLTATIPMPLADHGPRQRTETAIREIARQMERDEAVPPDAADLVERIRRRREALARGEELPAESLPVARAETPEPTASEAEPTPPRSIPAPVSESVEDRNVEAEAEAADPDEAIAADPAPRAVPAPRPKPKPRRKPSDEAGYNLPPVELLDRVPLRDDARHEAEKNYTARAIEETFANFGITVSVAAASRGPVITMYEILLQDQGMRVNKVEGFEKDLSLKLGTEGIRIVAPLPNKKTIGIEVPNKVKEAVVMRDLVEQTDASPMILPLILGRDVVGNPLLGDLGKMPHLLVAGATGTGKSVCMNAMICSILLFRGPDEVKFIMVDPKMVELAGYEDIPHLLTPPITDMTKAHAALEWACRTMDERYFALRLVGVRDLKAYNELGEPEIRNRLARKGKTLEDIPGLEVRMPLIVVLVDEYADLMMVNKEVEKSIIRLTQKSRAAGIHVILTTQRPSADVVTGLIKSNLPARICFRVADKSNSRVVLDAGGAECLLGRGDMLYLPPGTNALVRGQGVWMKDKEIEAIIEHAKSQGDPQYDDSITSAHAVAMVGGGGTGKGSEWVADRQFHEAVQSMYRYGRTGADFFRRKLNIGYNKATSYVEMLEDLGFVGPQKGTSPREIVRSWDDWIDLLKGQGVSWEEDDDLYHNPVQLGSAGRE